MMYLLLNTNNNLRSVLTFDKHDCRSVFCWVMHWATCTVVTVSHKPRYIDCSFCPLQDSADCDKLWNC